MQKNYTLIKRRRNGMLAAALVFLLMVCSSQVRAQYCAAANTDPNAAGSLMSNVTFGSINNTTGAVWTSPSGYNYYSALTTSVVIGTSQNLTISIDPPSTYTGAIVSVWIDWNQDGTLAASEWLQVGTNMTNAGSPYTISIPIPATATPGVTRMRIRSRGTGNPNGSGDACSSMGSGETEDYDISVVPATACSGTPVAGNAVVNPHNICLGQSVSLSLTGNTVASGLSYQWETASSATGPWTPIGGSLTAPNSSNTPSTSGIVYYRAQVKCGNDSAASAYDSVVVPTPFPGGIYTIDPSQPASGTNFQSFSAAVAAISCGITGAVVFNVAATTTPFIEQVTIPASVGATATNTVTFNGNGDTLRFAGTTAAPWTLGLNGADHFTFNNLHVVGTTTSAALVCHLWGQADSNTFNNCSFRAPANTTSTAAVPFSVSGSATAALTTGASGNGNTLNGCTMFSGYYNTVFYGNSAGANTGNKVINCKLQDFYFYGLYTYYQIGMTVTGDTVERPTRTTLSTFYGMYLTTASAGFLVEKNVVRNPFGAAPTNTGTAYGIYMVVAATAANEHKFYNNLIHLSTGNGIKYGLYLTGNYARAYHNTIAIDNTASSASAMYGLYATGTTGVAIRNNNVVITQPGTAIKYGLFYTGTGKNSNYNNIFVNSAGGTNYIGWYSTTSTGALSLAAWQAVAGGIFDTASVSEDPIFGAGTYVPTSGLMDNKGTPVGITTDLNGVSRSLTTPDVGAYEFTAPGCTGSPVAGSATGPASGMVCPNAPFSIALTGMSTGTGITIQWQSSPAGLGFWQNIPNANSSVLTEAAGINTPMDYQAVVVCTNGGGQDFSNVVSLGISPWQNCYCTPATAGGTTYYISGFTTTGAAANINSSTPTGTATGYKDLTGTPALVVVPGTTFNYTMTVAGGSTYGQAIWIDTNMDGTFQTTEQFVSSSSYIASPLSGSVTIPANTLTGLTRMRIVATFTPSNPSNPCINTGTGEYQDFMINIFVPSVCSGTPVAGTAYGVPDSTCPGRLINLSDTTATLATGISYQWQQSPLGAGTWTDIPGASTASYALASGVTAPTDFRLVVSCSASGLGDTSNVESVTYILPATQCYCVPTTGGGLTYYISGFTTTGAGSNIASTTASGTATGYKDLTAGPALTVIPGSSFNWTMTIAGGSTYGVGIWIDSNFDGTFQSNEQFVTTSAYAASPISGTISIPANATPGTGRIRILAAFTPSNPTNPCVNTGSGEYQDFTFVVGPPPTCPAPTGLTATNPTSTTVDLGWTSTAAQWQVEYAPGNTFLPGAGTRVGPAGVANPYTVTGLAPQQYSYFVRSICAPGDTSFWSQRQVFFPVPPNDDCINAIDISNGQLVSGYVNFATQSEPACDATVLANDVWYKFTTGAAATTATVNVNTTTSGTDVVIQAFSGTCGVFTPMTPTTSSGTGSNGCVDGPAAGLETATYAVSPNTTYYVRVYGYNTAQGTFPIRLAIPPVNDDICSATTLIVNDPVPSCVNTESATVGSSDPANACSANNNTVWYKFTPTLAQPHYLIVTVPVASADPLSAWLFTYTATGTCPGTLSLTAAGGIGTACQSNPYPATAGSVTSFTTASLTPNTTYYLFVDGNSGDVGDICFQILANPLSVKLADINAANFGNRNRVNWSSASEDRGDHYELERSADGVSFAKLTSLEGKGEPSVYTYWDETPLSGVNYYRLKMTDAAGKSEYSKVVTATVNGSGNFALEAYPNPVNDQLTVTASGISGKATVTITDATGKLVKVVTMEKGVAVVDMKGLAQGMYLVKYADSSRSQVVKVNKQ